MIASRSLMKRPLGLVHLNRLSTAPSRQQQQGHDQLKVFRDNASKWWNGKEFSILRAMNEIRVPFVVNGLGGRPMNETKILDIGCGGGILSEPLARLGAQVLGIDPVFESINQAQIHAETDAELKERLRYRSCNVEDLSSQPEHKETYDAVVASEVLEHIEDVENFLIHCTKLLKPNGSLFITTINQTPLSWLGVIFFGEYVLKQLPKGTHTYDMFVNVKGLRVMLERLGYHVRLVNGFMYEPVGGNFYWTPTTLTHYALHAVKMPPSSKKPPQINYEQRRYMAKPGAKGKTNRPKVILDIDEMTAVVPMDLYTSKANAIVLEFRDHLEKRLTIRTSTASVENLPITLEGLSEPLELRDVAQISMKNPSLIVINLSTMPEAIKPALKALEELGNLAPQVEVNNIYVPVPKVSRETRENLAQASKQAANGSKDKLKTLFSDFSSRAKKQKSMKAGVSDDLIFNTIENLHFDINKRVQEIDELLQKKLDKLLNQRN